MPISIPSQNEKWILLEKINSAIALSLSKKAKLVADLILEYALLNSYVYCVSGTPNRFDFHQKYDDSPNYDFLIPFCTLED